MLFEYLCSVATHREAQLAVQICTLIKLVMRRLLVVLEFTDEDGPLHVRVEHWDVQGEAIPGLCALYSCLVTRVVDAVVILLHNRLDLSLETAVLCHGLHV